MRRRFFLKLTVFLSALVFSMTAAAQQKFVVSVTGAQEVPVRALGGRGSCVITLNLTETEFSVLCNYNGVTTPVVSSHIHDAGPVGVNGPIRFNFNYTGATNGTIGPLTFAVTPAQVTDLRAGRWYVNIHTSNFTGGEIRGQVKPASVPFDFDGDGRTDIRTFRPSASTFYTLNSSTNTITSNAFAGGGTLNTASDDYDGDGRGDLVAFFSQGSALFWSILQTGTNTARQIQWGLTTDQVLPADYDGDGKTDIAVYRRSSGVWYIVRSSDGQTQAEVFGQPTGTQPDAGVVGDFDKDGKNDLTVVRAGTGGVTWFTRRSSDGRLQGITWGGAIQPVGDGVFAPAQIDVDGDGIQDHMVQRDPNISATGNPVTYYVRRSSDAQLFVLQWGLDTDTPLFGDYDGDGKTDFVARRTVDGQFVWYIYQSSNGQGRAVTFGAASDLRSNQSKEFFDENKAIPIRLF